MSSETAVGVFPVGWSKSNMSLKLMGSLVQENATLRKEKDDLSKKLDDLITSVDAKMNQMVQALDDIKNKEVIQQVVVNGNSKVQKENTKMNDTPIFIPSLDQNSLKSSISDIQKKIRTTNIEDSVRELSKLQGNTEK